MKLSKQSPASKLAALSRNDSINDKVKMLANNNDEWFLLSDSYNSDGSLLRAGKKSNVITTTSIICSVAHINYVSESTYMWMYDANAKH